MNLDEIDTLSKTSDFELRSDTFYGFFINFYSRKSQWCKIYIKKSIRGHFIVNLNND